MRTNYVLINRATAISEIPLVRASNSKSSAERIELIRDRLQQLKGKEPRTVKTLGSTIATIFQRQLSDKEVSGLIHELRIKGYVSVSGTKVTYAAIE